MALLILFIEQIGEATKPGKYNHQISLLFYNLF